ncbi:MAG: alpha/beta fold hydrolase [Pseudomonadota bacterium]
MIRFAAGIAIMAGVVYLLACLALFLSQRSFIFYPQPRSFGNADSVIKMKVPNAELTVSSRRLAGPGAVIYFGGNAEDVSGSLPTLAEAFPKHALYLMHYRGYGGSSGKPSQAAVFADALAMFDQLHAQHPNITLIGRSLGSGVAVYLASVRPAVRLVLVTPYDSLGELAARRFPMFPVSFLLTDTFESWRYAPLITVPTTLVAASDDEVIPRSSSKLLFTRFKPGVARWVDIPRSGHNTLSDHPAYAQALQP